MYHLIIDLEATCWERLEPTQPSEHQGENEIIEIGTALLGPELQLLLNHGWFVRPKVHLILTEFCTRLTSITQAQVDDAPFFPEAMNQFTETVTEIMRCPLRDATFVSWGNYDRTQFIHDCELHHIPYPFGEHLNLKEEFKRTYHQKKRAGMAAALSYFKIPLQGTHHRGKDDALNTAEIFRRMRTGRSS